MQKPKISIIISVYNHAHYVLQAIESVLNQSYSNFEIIAIDNGSNDESLSVMKSINNKRIRFYHFDKNQGISYAVNFGIQKALGEYVCLLGSDDIFLPNKLKKQVEYLDFHKKTCCVFSHIQFIDENNNTFKDTTHFYQNVFNQGNKTRYQYLKQFFYHGNSFCYSTACIRKSCLQTIGFNDRRLAQLHDFDMWIDLLLHYDIHIIQEPLVQFRIREGNMNASANTIQSQVRSMFEFGHVLKRFLKIKTTQEFLKIFPEQKKYNDIIDDSLIPFYVARLALEVKHVFHQKFALDTWFDLFTNKTLVQKMERICHFNYTDFIQYTGIHDIYHVQHVDFQNEKVLELSEEFKKLQNKSYRLKSILKNLFVNHA